jgi:putative transposase
MQDSSTTPTAVLQFRQDLQAKLRDGVRRAIETVLEEELLLALGADDHVRTPTRRGYRHGTTTRTVTTREGTRALTVPRARLRAPDGGVQEFQSTVVPRYARRTREVDDALLGCYFGGVNSRRIRTALKPLFGEAHFSKSAVSRVVARVKDLFLTWQQRPLADERYAVLFLDALHLRVRLAGRVISVPVLAALGVREDGQKQLVALQLAAAEATASWAGLLADLQRRGLPAPLLVIPDGHAGLKKALEAWPTVQVQRCTTHKGRNLEDACPVHARPELRRDYHRIIYAADGLAARAAYDACLKKWTALCAPVARSLDEAGLDRARGRHSRGVDSGVRSSRSAWRRSTLSSSVSWSASSVNGMPAPAGSRGGCAGRRRRARSTWTIRSCRSRCREAVTATRIARCC